MGGGAGGVLGEERVGWDLGGVDSVWVVVRTDRMYVCLVVSGSEQGRVSFGRYIGCSRSEKAWPSVHAGSRRAGKVSEGIDVLAPRATRFICTLSPLPLWLASLLPVHRAFSTTQLLSESPHN